MSFAIFKISLNNHYITGLLLCGSVNLGLPNIQIFTKKLEIFFFFKYMQLLWNTTKTK